MSDVGFRAASGGVQGPESTAASVVVTNTSATAEGTHMGYGIGGILVLILVILAIIYLAKRV